MIVHYPGGTQPSICIHFRTCRNKHSGVPLSQKECKFLWNNPCKTIETFHSWGFLTPQLTIMRDASLCQIQLSRNSNGSCFAETFVFLIFWSFLDCIKSTNFSTNSLAQMTLKFRRSSERSVLFCCFCKWLRTSSTWPLGPVSKILMIGRPIQPLFSNMEIPVNELSLIILCSCNTLSDHVFVHVWRISVKAFSKSTSLLHVTCSSLSLPVGCTPSLCPWLFTFLFSMLPTVHCFRDATGTCFSLTRCPSTAATVWKKFFPQSCFGATSTQLGNQLYILQHTLLCFKKNGLLCRPRQSKFSLARSFPSCARATHASLICLTLSTFSCLALRTWTLFSFAPLPLIQIITSRYKLCKFVSLCGVSARAWNVTPFKQGLCLLKKSRDKITSMANKIHAKSSTLQWKMLYNVVPHANKFT